MSPDTPDIPAVEKHIVEMTNKVRVEHKLGEVGINAKLKAAAKSYAEFLAKSLVFSHTADGREPAERATAAGYGWCSVGENLAAYLDSRGFETRELARKSVESWLNSPSHRENLLAPFATEIGVGVAQAADKYPKYILVQLLARPKSLAYEFQISNTTGEPVTYTFSGETQELAPRSGMRHQACEPSALTFDKIGTSSKALALSARFEASDGLVYLLKPDKAKGISVEIEPLQKVK
jgi:hypothetical protein